MALLGNEAPQAWTVIVSTKYETWGVSREGKLSLIAG
jgi:hypothetical protein